MDTLISAAGTVHIYMGRTYGSFNYLVCAIQRIKIRCYNIGRGYAPGWSVLALLAEIIISK
jgi:hypothetical protein